MVWSASTVVGQAVVFTGTVTAADTSATPARSLQGQLRRNTDADSSRTLMCRRHSSLLDIRPA
jgi:hypothetical protein